MTQRQNSQLIDNLKSVFQLSWDSGRAFQVAMSAHTGLLGLRGFWPGSTVNTAGDLIDHSGLGLTASYNGNPVIDLQNIVPMLTLDGTGDYWHRADEALLDILGSETYIATARRGLTLGCWVQFANAAGTLEGVFGKQDNSTGISYGIFRAATGIITGRVSNTGNVLTTFDAVESVASAANAWHHVVFSYDPSTEVALFVNGVKFSNTTSIPATIFNSTSDLVIGGFTGGASLMTGDVALPFLCVAHLPDALCQWLYHQTKAAFNRK